MKLRTRIETWTVLAGLAVATAASAQQEQWLQYHSGREGRGYTWLDLTTNPPPNVALPKFSAQPYFARWTTPLDPTGGRWLCFDRSRKSGVYDRLYIDQNGKGRLDDEKPVEASRREDYYAYFDTLRLVFKGEDGPLTYHLGLRFMKYSDGDVRLLAQSYCWYEGMINLGAKKQRIQLYDGNVNGVFNDLAGNGRDCDSLQIGGDKENETNHRLLGRLLELDGECFQIEVARDGAFVKIKKAENLTLGQVRVAKTISAITAVGENGQFIRHPTNGEFALPLGAYFVQDWAIDRKDKQGVSWKLSASTYGEAADFEVVAAQPAMLEVGEPLRAALQATESKGTVNFSLRLQGRYGESVEITRGGQRPRAPRLAVTSRDGSYSITNTFEYG
jgi:hypothetical protein